jgi:hypothetical protein
MATYILEARPCTSQACEQPKRTEDIHNAGQWLVFQYAPVALFSLKNSRATSTAGKTLLTPTPYAVKMAFLDAALRHGLTEDPDGLVCWLAGANLRLGVPRHACVTGTIQSVRQEIRDVERKRHPGMPPYRSTIAMREFVHYQGTMRLAFDLESCPTEFIALLLRVAPAINYLGKRGSFVQYLSGATYANLDSAFTQPIDDRNASLPAWGQRATLDDFGAKASFAALNSFAPTEVRRDIDRKFVETVIPLNVYNSGPGFVHYSAGGPEED